ncbi:MAG TPA: oxygen-independent coproporphyrinogen III oxidase-like protein [Sedimenticola sp.]|nr:oxygen-independent coproporphyrinogen III oxidase-like protein [Sedimenticola sp.]
MTLLQPPPLSLYIHIPWCIRKCPYCDFNSRAIKGDPDENACVDALLADLDTELPQVRGRTLHSVFIGGGTPSLLSGAAVERLLAGVRQRMPCPSGMEITLEANPGALASERFGPYRAAGINRLSIGVQSFDAGCLQRLGRIHGPGEAIAAVEAARAAGFDNINLDLMFGLPGQGLDQARMDLDTAAGLGPAHISYYQLTLEPGTPFFRSPPPLPAEEGIWEMQRQGRIFLQKNGYAQYEVSAYARPGRQCRHNLNYWTFGDYLGIGAGAHGKISDASGRIMRRWKVAAPEAYLKAAGTGKALAGQRRLTHEDIVLEFMMNALRLHQGFSRSLFEARTGLPFERIQARLDKAVQRGLLEPGADGARPSSSGRRFLNDLLALFLPDGKSPLK